MMNRLKAAWRLLRGHTVIYRADITGAVVLHDPFSTVMDTKMTPA